MVWPILNHTILEYIGHSQARCEIRPYVSPQVGLQSTWLKADWFKRGLQYITWNVLLLFWIELSHRIQEKHLTSTFTPSCRGRHGSINIGRNSVAVLSLNSQWRTTMLVLCCICLKEINGHWFPSCTFLFLQPSYETQTQCWSESTGESGPTVCCKQLVPKPGPHRWNTPHMEGKAAQKLLWRNAHYWLQSPFRARGNWMSSGLTTICSPCFTGAFPFLSSRRSQTHFGLNALTAYWKPTGCWCSILRINYVIFKISKRHIFSSNKEQILWAVGSGNPLAAHCLDAGEMAHEDQRQLGWQDQLSSQRVKIKHRW